MVRPKTDVLKCFVKDQQLVLAGQEEKRRGEREICFSVVHFLLS